MVCGLSLAVVLELLIVVASLVAEHGLENARVSVVAVCGLSSCRSWSLEHRLSSCGAWAYFSTVCGILPEQGLNLCALHWQADFLTTGSSGKPLNHSFHKLIAVLVFLGSWIVPSVSTVVVQLLSHIQLSVTP